MIDTILKGILEDRIADINTCALAKVKKVNIDGTSNIEINQKKIYKDGKKESYPLLVDIKKINSVGTLVVGNTVLVIFLQSAADNVGLRKHNISDAIIVGRL